MAPIIESYAGRSGERSDGSSSLRERSKAMAPVGLPYSFASTANYPPVVSFKGTQEGSLVNEGKGVPPLQLGRLGSQSITITQKNSLVKHSLAASAHLNSENTEILGPPSPAEAAQTEHFHGITSERNNSGTHNQNLTFISHKSSDLPQKYSGVFNTANQTQS